LLACRQVLSPQGHRLQAFPSLYRARAQGRGRETPARSISLGRGHRAGGRRPWKYRTGPAVKTSNPRLSPRDAGRAVGGIRAWAENPGRRASHLRLYSYSGRLCEPDHKSLLGRGHPPRRRPGAPPTEPARRGSSARRRRPSYWRKGPASRTPMTGRPRLDVPSSAPAGDDSRGGHPAGLLRVLLPS